MTGAVFVLRPDVEYCHEAGLDPRRKFFA